MALCISPCPDALPKSRHFSSSTSSLFQHCTTLHQLKQIHARIIRRNLHGNQLILTKLIRLYCSHGKLDYVNGVFNTMANSQTFAWNLIIRSHTTHNSSHRALVLYNLMITNGVSPDKFTFPFTIKACTSTRVLDKGKEVHGLALKSGFSRDIYFKNTLIDFYLKCGELDYGRKLFDKMSVRNVVTWTTMLSGLVDSGDLDSARELFDEMPVRNVVSWTAMINGYVGKGKLHESFELFWQMQSEGVSPNEQILVCLLRACSDLRSLELGALIHDYAIKNRFKLGIYLGTSLIDMYSKCGSLDEARKVFDLMDHKSTATWNSMISSLGVHGYGEEAIKLFEQMAWDKEVEPDAISFAGVLCACVQTNEVDRGLRYFRYMIEYNGIIPILDHYVCMFQLWSFSEVSLENSCLGVAIAVVHFELVSKGPVFVSMDDICEGMVDFKLPSIVKEQCSFGVSTKDVVSGLGKAFDVALQVEDSNLESVEDSSLHENGCSDITMMSDKSKDLEDVKAASMVSPADSEGFVCECATFPLTGCITSTSTDRMDDQPEDASCMRPKSLPVARKVISAMKGSREKEGLPPRDLYVSWAPDVYDPPPSSVSHLPKRNITPSNRSSKRYAKGKQKSKTNSQGSRKKDKKHHHRKGGEKAEPSMEGSWKTVPSNYKPALELHDFENFENVVGVAS